MAIRKVLGLMKQLVLALISRVEPRVESRWWVWYRTAVNTGTVVLMALLILSPLCAYPFLLELAFKLKSPLCYVLYGFWWLCLVGGSIGAGLMAYTREKITEKVPKKQTAS